MKAEKIPIISRNKLLSACNRLFLPQQPLPVIMYINPIIKWSISLYRHSK
jgi:hypothetical protein